MIYNFEDLLEQQGWENEITFREVREILFEQNTNLIELREKCNNFPFKITVLNFKLKKGTYIKYLESNEGPKDSFEGYLYNFYLDIISGEDKKLTEYKHLICEMIDFFMESSLLSKKVFTHTELIQRNILFSEDHDLNATENETQEALNGLNKVARDYFRLALEQMKDLYEIATIIHDDKDYIEEFKKQKPPPKNPLFNNYRIVIQFMHEIGMLNDKSLKNIPALSSFLIDLFGWKCKQDTLRKNIQELRNGKGKNKPHYPEAMESLYAKYPKLKAE